MRVKIVSYQATVLADEMQCPRKGSFILPETLVLAGSRFRLFRVFAAGVHLYQDFCKDETPTTDAQHDYSVVARTDTAVLCNSGAHASARLPPPPPARPAPRTSAGLLKRSALV